MASTRKYIRYRLPFILVVISFILMSAWQFYLQRDIGAVLTLAWFWYLFAVPAILPFALICLYKIRIKWLHSIFEALCIVAVIVTIFYAIFRLLALIGLSPSFITFRYISYFRASYVLLNLYQLITDGMSHLVPLAANGLLLAALLQTTAHFHRLSR